MLNVTNDVQVIHDASVGLDVDFVKNRYANLYVVHARDSITENVQQPRDRPSGDVQRTRLHRQRDRLPISGRRLRI